MFEATLIGFGLAILGGSVLGLLVWWLEGRK